MITFIDNKFSIPCSVCETSMLYTTKSYANNRLKNKAKCFSCRTAPLNKICVLCKTDKAIGEFPSRGGSQSHLFDSRCKDCKYAENSAWRKEHKDKIMEYRAKDTWTLKKRCARYGMSETQFWDMYTDQNKQCKICCLEIEAENSAIDHNHSTGEIRGILCKTCNRALGLFRDSPKVLENALDYLMLEGYYGEA